MKLSDIRSGMQVHIETIPPSPLKERLRQFGLMEGMEVGCRYARGNLVALEWIGTVVAVRRKDIGDIMVRVVA